MFGSNPSVSNTKEEAIWPLGGDVAFPTGVHRLRVRAGGDAADTIDGAGARTLLISGLDEDWEFSSEMVDLNGANASALTQGLFVRVNMLSVREVGTYGGSNVGQIIVETESGIALASVTPTAGDSTDARTSISRSSIGYLQRVQFWTSDGAKVRVRLLARCSADIQVAPGMRPLHTHHQAVVTGVATLELVEAPIVLRGPLDLCAVAQSLMGGPEEVSCDFSGVLIAD